jgi:hypothetical protein
MLDSLLPHPQIGKGDELLVWTVASNALNKQLWTDNKGWSFSVGFVDVKTSML